MASDPSPLLRSEEDALALRFEDGTLQSRTDPDDPARLLLEYTRLMMGFLLLQPTPERIALIGLGGGSLAKYCARKLPTADITAVEISPQVIALRDEFGIPPDGPRFRVVCDDGAAFVRRAGEPYDVLLVDAFDRGGQPEETCTLAFYDACRARLADGGVLVANLYADDGALEVRLERVRSAFDGRIAAARADESENLIVFAGTDEPFPPPFRELVTRLRALESTHPVGLDVAMRKLLAYGESRAPRRQRRSGRDQRAARAALGGGSRARS